MAFSFFKRSKPEPEPRQATSSHYRELTVLEVVRETRDAVSLVFAAPEKPLVYKPGQFLTLIFQIDGKEVRRAYSLCSSPHVDLNPSVAVKRVEKGQVSSLIVDTVKEGQRIRIMEPTGNFTTPFDPATKRHLIMFAGGSGITPMMAIIKSLLTQEPESICSLIYCNRDEHSIIFRNALDQLQVRFEGRLHVIHVLDQAPMNWQGYSGLLNQSLLEQLFERIPDWGIDRTLYLMCGPEGMMKNVGDILAARGIPSDKVMRESFVQGTIDKAKKPEAETQAAAVEREVTIRYDGQEFKVSVPPGKTILETALGQGIDLPYSCQSGLCTACRGKALSGKVKLDEEDGLSKSELEEGYVLTCVGHPLTDDVVIEIG